VVNEITRLFTHDLDKKLICGRLTMRCSVSFNVHEKPVAVVDLSRYKCTPTVYAVVITFSLRWPRSLVYSCQIWLLQLTLQVYCSSFLNPAAAFGVNGRKHVPAETFAASSLLDDVGR